MSERKGDWIQTFTGRQFWPLDPRPDEIVIEDIAHAVSNICRYNGHCASFYSVAEHSRLVSQLVFDATRDATLALCGLLHDASEAYLLDIPRPIKPLLIGYAEMEERLQEFIHQRFGLPRFSDTYPIVKPFDSQLMADEGPALMPNATFPWWEKLGKPFGVPINCYYPVDAERGFLAEFHRLMAEIKGESHDAAK